MDGQDALHTVTAGLLCALLFEHDLGDFIDEQDALQFFIVGTTRNILFELGNVELV